MDAIKNFANNFTNRDQNNSSKIVPIEDKEKELFSIKNSIPK